MFSLDLSVPEGADPIAVADWVLDVLCNQDPTECPYVSCDAVDPDWKANQP